MQEIAFELQLLETNEAHITTLLESVEATA